MCTLKCASIPAHFGHLPSKLHCVDEQNGDFFIYLFFTKIDSESTSGYGCCEYFAREARLPSLEFHFLINLFCIASTR